ncbi:MAG: NAD+ synthase [bacterium]|nr:NAD+ synthase [bacterium]
MKELDVNTDLTRRLLTQFIREHTHKQGFERVVLGLSGGLDSSVCVYLAVEALGKDDVVGVFLPHQQSDPNSLKDAQSVAMKLGLHTWLIDITPMVKVYEDAFPQMNRVQLGNIMARCRMTVLYQISALEEALVLGTSNKSELLLGYGTLHGDLACAFDPLGDLYKTQVRSLAQALGVPKSIQEKTPSADLWEGQSDEGELGFTYAEADRFLVRWIDGRYNRDELLAEGFSPDFIDCIMKRVTDNQFKRTLPVIPKLSNRTIGADFLYPRDWMK